MGVNNTMQNNIYTLEYKITIIDVNTGRCWNEFYYDYVKVSKRIKKLRYSQKLKIIDFDSSCTDDTYALQHLYEYGY